jgi:peptidoglycan/LPS O-acetylase OafA/YrhL
MTLNGPIPGTEGAGQIRSIQALRAFAACAVVYLHATQRAVLVWGRHDTVSESLGILGYTGVDLFFLLSGFLMTHLHKEQFGSSGNSANFFRRRMIRIVPLYWTLNCVGLIALWMAPHSFSHARHLTLTWMLGNFLFLPIPAPMTHIIVVGWTLDYEMYFYVLFAVAMLFRRGLAFLVIFLLTSFAAGIVHQPSNPWLALVTSPLLLEFLAGMGIAVLLSRVRLSPITGWFALIAGIAMLVISLLLVLDVGEHIEWSVGTSWALVLTGCLAIDFQFRGALGQRLAYIADASYSIYLVQVFAIPLAASAVDLLGFARLPLDLSITILWVIGCAAGILCWIFVEKPITTLVRRYTTEPRARATVMSASGSSSL